VKEHGDKVTAADKTAIEGAIETLKTALQGEDVEAIKARTNDLMQASMKLGEAMYKAAQESAATGEGGDGTQTGGETKKEDVIDADFQEVNDDANKKKRA
jgi:molecular chaperone DnaK